MPEDLESEIHYLIVRGLMGDCRCPTPEELSRKSGASREQVRIALEGLAEKHCLVLHPNSDRVWVVHPFSVTPTHTFVQSDGGKGWWAPCMWCAFGVAHLVKGGVTIHARIAGEAEPAGIRVVDGVPEPSVARYVHFAVPPARAWENVHHHCAMLLPFNNEADIDAWTERHGLERGKAVAIEQAALFAGKWYGRHADRKFRKWTTKEAQRLFHDAGLREDFWKIEMRAGNF